MKTQTTNITDNQRLTSVINRFGRQLPIYDDGFGPLWIHRDSMGISGIVRAQTWEHAYSICEDEFFPDADAEGVEELERIDAMPDGEEKNHAQACWGEAYGFRNNGRRTLDGYSHIYAKDMNGDRLDRLTDELAAELELTVKASTDNA